MRRSNLIEEPELPLSRFTYDSEDRSLTASASDFGKCPAFYNAIHQIYSDACDIGITIHSEITGSVETFYWCEEEGRNRDYSLGHDVFIFRPVNQHLRISRVVVFND